jgi:hypothetical protein
LNLTIVEATPKASPSSTPSPIITASPSSNPRVSNPIQVDDDVTWEFKKCARQQAYVNCSFVLTTIKERKDYGLRLYDSNKMTDRQGREYLVNYAIFVNSKEYRGSTLEREMQKGSTYDVSMNFTVPSSVTELNSLIVVTYTRQIKFDNIIIN